MVRGSWKVSCLPRAHEDQEISRPVCVCHFRTQVSLLERKDFNQLLQHYGGDMATLKQELNNFNTFVLATQDKEIEPQTYRFVTLPLHLSMLLVSSQLSRNALNGLQDE